MTTPPFPNSTLCSDTIALDKNAIVAFAARFDPQPYHLDADAAAQSIFGGLCASGWHIAALATRLVSETLLSNGMPFVQMTSVSQLKWHQPTFVNEQISVRIALGAMEEESRIVGTHSQAIEVDVCNEDGAVVAKMTATAAMESIDEIPEKYWGLDRYDARRQILQDLEAEGLVEREEVLTNVVPHGTDQALLLNHG